MAIIIRGLRGTKLLPKKSFRFDFAFAAFFVYNTKAQQKDHENFRVSFNEARPKCIGWVEKATSITLT